MFAFKPMLPIAVLAAAGLILTGCSSGSSEQAATTTAALPVTTAPVTTTPAPTTTTLAPTTTTAATTTTAPPADPNLFKASDGAYYFSSPDGNFQCGIVALPTRSEAGCQGVTAPIPPKPDSCMISWGNGISVTNTDVGAFLCSGGLVYTSGGETIDPPLPLGEHINQLGFTCNSAENGIACINDATRHGFRIAPDSNDVF